MKSKKKYFYMTNPIQFTAFYNLQRLGVERDQATRDWPKGTGQKGPSQKGPKI